MNWQEYKRKVQLVNEVMPGCRVLAHFGPHDLNKKTYFKMLDHALDSGKKVGWAYWQYKRAHKSDPEHGWLDEWRCSRREDLSPTSAKRTKP